MLRSSLLPAPATRLWPVATPAQRVVRNLVLALAGTLLLALSARVQVPFYPVPMTFQTAVVFLIGIAYGWRLGAATVLLYLGEAAMGLPVLAGTPEKGIGLAYMLGTTGGYLAGFVAAAAICGYVAERARGVLALGLGVLVATATVYLLGAAWLASFVGLENALILGVLPFLPGDLVKLLLVTAVARASLRPSA